MANWGKFKCAFGGAGAINQKQKKSRSCIQGGVFGHSIKRRDQHARAGMENDFNGEKRSKVWGKKKAEQVAILLKNRADDRLRGEFEREENPPPGSHGTRRVILRASLGGPILDPGKEMSFSEKSGSGIANEMRGGGEPSDKSGRAQGPFQGRASEEKKRL